MYDAVDLFAGPGGWDVAARDLGLTTVGIEFEVWACATRVAAGLPTINSDVRRYSPADFITAGLIASPPCQTFSMAGKGSGRAALDVVLAGIDALATRSLERMAFDDDRTSLVLEPLRWALEARDLGIPYEWLAFEQVPTVLPVWEAMAVVLRAEGYSVATGNLQAEQYGVPQTRKRAVLVARLHGEARLPTPTHSRYYVRDKTRLDPDVLPWVSMAEALGWGMTARPSMTVTGGGSDTGGPEPFGNAAQQGIDRERSSGRWGAKPLGSGSGAARAMLEEAQAGRFVEPSQTVSQQSNYRTHGEKTPEGKWPLGERELGEPSSAITGKPPRWMRSPQSIAGGERAFRTENEPAVTVTGNADRAMWVHERPATTVVGSFNPDVIAAPGYRVSAEDGSRQNAKGSVRVTPEEAACLQSFPAGYPWQGPKSKVYQQIGNAIPPLLARAVLVAATQEQP